MAISSSFDFSGAKRMAVWCSIRKSDLFFRFLEPDSPLSSESSDDEAFIYSLSKLSVNAFFKN